MIAQKIDDRGEALGQRHRQGADGVRQQPERRRRACARSGRRPCC